jgi:hypothetical protein
MHQQGRGSGTICTIQLGFQHVACSQRTLDLCPVSCVLFSRPWLAGAVTFFTFAPPSTSIICPPCPLGQPQLPRPPLLHLRTVSNILLVAPGGWTWSAPLCSTSVQGHSASPCTLCGFADSLSWAKALLERHPGAMERGVGLKFWRKMKSDPVTDDTMAIRCPPKIYLFLHSTECQMEGANEVDPDMSCIATFPQQVW